MDNFKAPLVIEDTEDEFEQLVNKSAESEVDSKFDDIVQKNFREDSKITKIETFLVPENPGISNSKKVQNMIPSGRNIPRTPKKSEDDDDETIDENSGFQEKLTKFKRLSEGPSARISPRFLKSSDDFKIPKGNSIPRTPFLDEQKAEIFIVPEVSKPSEEPETNKKFFIPKGKSIPRTPYLDENSAKMEKFENPENSKNEEKVENQEQPKAKKNFIPTGKHVLPRTPFLGGNPGLEEPDTPVDHPVDSEVNVKGSSINRHTSKEDGTQNW